MPKFVDPLVVMGVPASNRQTTIYDRPSVDMVPTTIQSHKNHNKDPVTDFAMTQNTKKTMKEPLIYHPDMNRSNDYYRDKRRYRDDSGEN